MRISFDFDSTLSLPIIQELAKRHILFGDDVYIVTTRNKDNLNKDLRKVLKSLEISEESVIFTSHQDKVHFLDGFDIHYDDDEYEIDLITRSELTCLGILINYKNYNLNE